MLQVRCDEAHVRRDESLWTKDGNVLSCHPVMAHVPKAINGDFGDKNRVPTLKGSNLEKRKRRTGRLASTLGRFGDPEEDD